MSMEIIDYLPLIGTYKPPTKEMRDTLDKLKVLVKRHQPTLEITSDYRKTNEDSPLQNKTATETEQTATIKENH